MPREVRLPTPQRRNIDIFALSQALAAPEVARQRAKAAGYQTLGQMPQDIFETYQGMQEQKKQQAQAEFARKMAETKESREQAESQNMKLFRDRQLAEQERQGLTEAAYKQGELALKQAESRNRKDSDFSEKKSEQAQQRIELRKSEMKNSYVKQFNLDPSVKKSQSSIDGANYVRGLVESGNPIGQAAVPTFMARASGEVGALTEADKAPFGGSKAIISRIAASAKSMAGGTLTEENKKFLLDLTNVFEKRANENIANLAKKRSKQYSKLGLLTEKEIFDILYSSPGINETAEIPGVVFDE